MGWVSYPDAQAAIGRLTSAALDGHAALDDATKARLIAQQVAALGNYAEARGAALTAEAMALARRSGDPAALLEAIGAWMSSKPEVGGADEQRELAEEAVRLALRVGQPLPELMAHTWRLNAVVQLGLMDLVNEALEALRRIAEESRLPLATWHWLRASVAVAVLRGDFAAVEERHQRATSIARDSGDVVAANVGNAAVFEVALRRGVSLPDPERMLRDLEGAPISALIQAPRAMVLDQLGRHDEARVIYQRLVPSWAHRRSTGPGGRSCTACSSSPSGSRTPQWRRCLSTSSSRMRAARSVVSARAPCGSSGTRTDSSGGRWSWPAGWRTP